MNVAVIEGKFIATNSYIDKEGPKTTILIYTLGNQLTEQDKKK